MIADAGAPVLLTQERLRGAVPSEGVSVLTVEEVSAQGDVAETAALGAGVGAADAAYVIYTSGSTGTPKGVCVSHQAVVRLVVETDFIRVVPEDRVAQASNASFDAATFEIWGALLNGARVVGVDRETALSPSAFASWLREEGIRVLFLTTAWFNQVAAEVPDAFSGLRQLHFGGEAVDPRPVRRVLREGAPERLLHVYGPTENTTFSTWHLVTEVPEGAVSIPIGKPLANTVQYVLDEDMAPVPPGGVGELWLGGDGLAWGYLGQPALTAERFVPNPFSERPGTRLYRTGDRVRLLADGAVTFEGRVDAQVKVRGFRVEPGEVEAALLRHPDVRQAVVLAREDEAGGSRRLVAYVVPTAEAAATAEPSLLRTFLAAHLPAYMVPSAFMVLGRLPLTPNGKVDRRALPAPTVEPEVIAPRGPEEELLARLFGELLGVSRVGASDSFFDLGDTPCWPLGSSRGFTPPLASPCRCGSSSTTRPWRGWPSASARPGSHLARRARRPSSPCPGTTPCHCPRCRSACGCWSSSSRARPSTTSLGPHGSPGRWTCLPWSGHWRGCSCATKP